jgi:hypothetical protein
VARHLKHSLSAISLLICATLIFLWYRSHRVADWITWSNGRGVYYEYVTLPGQFRVTRVTAWPSPQPLEWKLEPFPPLKPVFGQQPVYRTWAIIGVGFDGGSRKINSPDAAPGAYSPLMVAYQITAVPFAVPAFVTAIIGLLPWMRMRRRIRQRDDRLKSGLCPQCGYDLRASEKRCPECGAETVSPGCETP